MINELCKQAYAKSKAKGFYDDPPRPLERHMLMVSEIAEASEEVRRGNPFFYYDTPTGRAPVEALGGTPAPLSVGAVLQKPEGELVELADCMIRIMDYCGSKGWDLEEAIRIKMEYNSSRPYKHGKLK